MPLTGKVILQVFYLYVGHKIGLFHETFPIDVFVSRKISTSSYSSNIVKPVLNRCSLTVIIEIYKHFQLNQSQIAQICPRMG